VVVRSLLSSKRKPRLKIHKSLGKNKNMNMGPSGTGYCFIMFLKLGSAFENMNVFW
jgi:hypothetical protein